MVGVVFRKQNDILIETKMNHSLNILSNQIIYFMIHFKHIKISTKKIFKIKKSKTKENKKKCIEHAIIHLFILFCLLELFTKFC